MDPTTASTTPFTIQRFNCSNPNCSNHPDIKNLQHQVSQTGMEFVHCGQVVYQIVKCDRPGCEGHFILCSPTDNPMIDMRGLILAPTKELYVAVSEQSKILQQVDSWHDYLKFKYIPAWDKETVSKEEFIEYAKKTSPLAFAIAVSWPNEYRTIFHNYDSFYKYFNILTQTGKNHFRKLYPYSDKFYLLSIVLSPLKIGTPLNRGISADRSSIFDLTTRLSSWKSLIEAWLCTTFEKSITDKLDGRGITITDPKMIDELVINHIRNSRPIFENHLWEYINSDACNDKIEEFLRKIYKKIFYPVYSEIALKCSRANLNRWVEAVKPGKTLIVDAPMGLGKTYSIIEALTSNTNMSAVIFMPTKIMCEEIIENLKFKMVVNDRSLAASKKSEEIREAILDENGNPIIDIDGFPETKYSRNFLIDQVYYADGINEVECPHFDEIIERYKYKNFTKRDICEKCENYKDIVTNKVKCRFHLHEFDAPKSRIIVATHQMYQRFRKKFKKWKQDNKTKVDRDFFIIDEDIIIPQCYQPGAMNGPELKALVSTFSNFITNFQDTGCSEEEKKIIEKFESVLSRFYECDYTAVVSPVDVDFKIPENILKEWTKNYVNHEEYIPETLDWDHPIVNNVSLIENAIRKGFVVQNYTATSSGNCQSENKKVKKAFLPNPTVFDLSKLPPHIFFDGTMFDEEILKHKIKGVDLDFMSIEVKPIWDIRVHQNEWSDLPVMKLLEEKDKVLNFVSRIIQKHGLTKRYFFVTKKTIREEYLDEWLKDFYPTLDPVISHYGNLRGINDAKDCDIGIMLGSFAPSDAVEIAMAIDFIQDKIGRYRLMPTKGPKNMWTFKGKNFQRVYNKNYEIVGKFADAYRRAEHRQAIARTRYLSHDIVFYIISKERVETYEKYLTNVERYDYQLDLFFKKIRKDIKYKTVKLKVKDWLSKNQTVRAIDIAKNYTLRRQTVAKYLKQMYQDGLLVLAKKSKTIYKKP